MASRGLKTMRGSAAPKVKNSQVPPMGAYCSPDSVPHIGNSKSSPGGNKAKMTKPGNSVALRKK